MRELATMSATFTGVLGLVLLSAIGLLATMRFSGRRSRQSRSNGPRTDDERIENLDSRQLRELVRLSGDFIWQTDEKHRLILLSGELHMSALTAEQAWTNRALWELAWTVPPTGDWQPVIETFEQRRPVRMTLRADDGEGAARFFELSGQAFLNKGEFVGYLGVGREITNHVEAERALQDSQARYQEVIDSVREVVFRTDGEMRLTFLNPAWEVYTDLTVGECIGRSLLDFIHPDDRNTTAHELERVLAREVSEYNGQLRLPSRHGEIRWIEATARPVQNRARASEPISLVGTFDDISSRKVAEMSLKNVNHELESRVRMRTSELEASNRELEAFSYSVSHDLRAPLRSIDGFTRVLEEDLGERLDPASRDHLARIRNAAGRMAYLIDNLIELARLSRHEVRKETVNLSDIAVQIIDDLRAEEPSRTVEVEITRDLTVTADKTLMRVVLENLLRNAWKFSARRTDAKISFNADRTGDKRVFRITDNGVGFDMDFSAHLFRAFYRLHDHAEFPGSGIGLANVQRIIQRHGGQIWAKSAPDQGATFYFSLDS